MVPQNKLLIGYSIANFLVEKDMSLKVVLLSVCLEGPQCPTGFFGVTSNTDRRLRTPRETSDSDRHPCIKVYYGLILCKFLCYFAYNNIVNHIIKLIVVF